MIAVELAIVIVLIVINGLLSMSEMAVVSSRRARLKPLADRGSRGARQALALADAPGRFLSTVQIGITLIGVLAGAFSGANLSARLAEALVGYGVPAKTADNVALGLVVAAITYLSLIIGELVPKQLALRSPERIAAGVAGPMSIVAKIATPAVVLLDWSSAAVLRLFGRAGERQHVTQEEIRAMIAEAESAGTVDPDERRMLAGVMRLADISVRAIMTPRLDIEWVDVAAADAVLLAAIRDSERTRLLACEGSADNVVGVLHVRDFLLDRLGGGAKPIRDMLHQPILLPDTLDALEALDRLHGAVDALGLVIDEYGHSEGVVTPADARRAVRGGAVSVTADDDPKVVARADGSWLVSGALAVEVLEDTLGVPLPRDRDYHTVAGLILHEMRRIPAVAEAIVIDGWRLEVVDMDGRRIDQVLVAKTG
ncbi:hemolysin family protein [Reyranella sp. CPCC 100927]|uniref:hemolysin family protein n=1 Tax=Reyranella sp. CPCC 100927 TaxID=2599616 RepID=UPI0011B833E9|nr:hemolysin family protein [Reyranella sp. CPCC 100927]TWS99643.1 HlyC/CorC family transporter [Reyranella sp. CPCC 100927]